MCFCCSQAFPAFLFRASLQWSLSRGWMNLCRQSWASLFLGWQVGKGILPGSQWPPEKVGCLVYGIPINLHLPLVGGGHDSNISKRLSVMELRRNSDHHSHCHFWMWSKHHPVCRAWHNLFIRRFGKLKTEVFFFEAVVAEWDMEKCPWSRDISIWKCMYIYIYLYYIHIFDENKYLLRWRQLGILYVPVVMCVCVPQSLGLPICYLSYNMNSYYNLL